MRSSQLSWIVLSIGVLVGCTTGRAPAGASLDGTYWLTELNGKPALTTGGPDRAHLRFVRDSALVSGGTGCNRFSGTFTHDGTALHFPPLATTMMACVDQGIAEQEHALLAALGATERYAMAGDTLTLIGSSGNLARFVRGSPAQ
jgi:heat shock protein HslJ